MNFISIPQEAFGQHIAILGKSGSGKTYTAKGVVERLLSQEKRVVIVDPLGVWWGLRSSENGKAGGFPLVIFGGVHADVDVSVSSGEALAKTIVQQSSSCIIDTSEFGITERKRFMTSFLSVLYKKNKTPIYLILDEADEIAPQNPMSDEKVLLNRVDQIVRRGRVKGFRVTMITQRPAVIHKNVLSQLNALVAMRVTSPQDRKAIEAWVEGNADKEQARQVIQTLARLKVGEGWIWFPSNDLLKRGTFPKNTTFDSSRTPGDDEKLIEADYMADVDVSGFKFLEATDEERLGDAISPQKVTRINGLVSNKKIIAKAREDGLEEGYKLGFREGFSEAFRQVKASIADISPPGEVTFKKPEKVENASVSVKVQGKELNGDLGAERRPLETLVAHFPAGFTEAQWATLTGMKRSGTWSTYKSRLRSNALIRQEGDLYFATEIGVEILGRVQPQPKSSYEIVEMWKRAVGGSAGKILQHLVDIYPRTISRVKLADLMGFSEKSGTYSTYISRLSGNGLVIKRNGELKASDDLF